METPMDNWNDDRLDELSRRMDDGFNEMREGFEKTVTREEIKELITAINARFDRLENRVDRIYYGCIALVVVLVGNSVGSSVLG